MQFAREDNFQASYDNTTAKKHELQSEAGSRTNKKIIPLLLGKNKHPLRLIANYYTQLNATHAQRLAGFNERDKETGAYIGGPSSRRDRTRNARRGRSPSTAATRRPLEPALTEKPKSASAQA
jgi:hypothetical protein